MSKSTLAETLQHMAQVQDGRSETSRLRDVFPEVERALAAGVRRKAILEALHQDGFTMNMKAFEKALYRIRKKAKLSVPQVPKPQPTKSVQNSPETMPDKDQPVATSKPHPFAGLGGEGRDKNAVHHSVPDLDRIYGRKKAAVD